MIQLYQKIQQFLKNQMSRLYQMNLKCLMNPKYLKIRLNH